MPIQAHADGVDEITQPEIVADDRDGYVEAFYKIADALGIGGARPISPKAFFETIMLPRITVLTCSGEADRKSRCAGCDQADYHRRSVGCPHLPPIARVQKHTGALRDMAVIVWLGEQPTEGTLLYADITQQESSNMINITQHLGLLGLRVEDRVTGFRGVVASVTFDLYGCIQAIVNPGMSADGKLGEVTWFDIGRLRVLDVTPVLPPPQFDWSPQCISQGKKGPGERPSLNKV